MNNTIYTVSAECGRGKTFSYCQYVTKNIKNNNYIYVAPTKKLLDQTEKQLIKNGVKNVKVIYHNKKNNQPIISQISEYIMDVKQKHTKGNVLLITQVSFFNLPEFIQLDYFDVTIDEVPQIDKRHFPTLQYNYSVLKEYLQIDDVAPVNDEISRIIPTNREKLEYFVKTKSKDDDVNKLFKDLFMDVLNDNKDVFVDIESWENNKSYRTYFISMLNPNRFINATLLGANIENSMLYDWFKRFHNINFIDHKEISNYLLEKSKLDHRLQVQYIFEDKQWSKTLANKSLKNGKTYLDAVNAGLKKEIGDKKFLLTANIDYEGGLELLPNCQRIPVDSKGSNQYDDCNLIVHIPALNREPKHFNMLHNLGFCDELIMTSTGYEVLYQNLMRTALRDKNSEIIVTLITPSEYEADFILGMFQGGEKKRILDLKYKPYKAFTPTEKNQRSKVNNMKKDILNGCDLKLDDKHISVTFQQDKYGKTSEEYSPVSLLPKDFKQYIKDFSKTIIKDKEQELLINPSIYNTPDNKDDSYRDSDNFKQSSLLILDFDNGNLSIDDFIRIFDKDAKRDQKHSFIICNSFSRCKDEPNRFRVFMPLKSPALSIDEYNDAFDYIVRILEKNSYTRKQAKLDPNSRSPVQSYYVPSTNREHKDYYHFSIHGWLSDRMLKQRSIDVQKIKTIIPVTSIPMDFNSMDNVINIDQKIQDARNQYNSVPVGKGERNTAFYTTGLSLLHYLKLSEIKQLLTELAGNDHKMIGRIEPNIKSYSKKLNIRH